MATDAVQENQCLFGWVSSLGNANAAKTFSFNKADFRTHKIKP